MTSLDPQAPEYWQERIFSIDYVLNPLNYKLNEKEIETPEMETPQDLYTNIIKGLEQIQNHRDKEVHPDWILINDCELSLPSDIYFLITNSIERYLRDPITYELDLNSQEIEQQLYNVFTNELMRAYTAIHQATKIYTVERKLMLTQRLLETTQYLNFLFIKNQIFPPPEFCIIEKVRNKTVYRITAQLFKITANINLSDLEVLYEQILSLSNNPQAVKNWLKKEYNSNETRAFDLHAFTANWIPRTSPILYNKEICQRKDIKEIEKKVNWLRNIVLELIQEESPVKKK